MDSQITETEPSSPASITFRKGQSDRSDFRGEFKKFEKSIHCMFETWLQRQDEKLSKLITEFEDVKTSFQFMNDQYEELKNKTQGISNKVRELELKANSSQSSEARINILEAKLEVMEQKSRSCNIEISNMPEKRGENLINIVESIASIIKQPIPARDIVTVHRVPQMQPNTKKPKNIIVKFTSQIIRDNIISAVRLKKGLTTDELGIKGSSQKVYINEHLTLQNKLLFRRVREIAAEKGYRFVWIKNGTILVRADISSTITSIRSEKDLSKIKSRNA